MMDFGRGGFDENYANKLGLARVESYVYVKDEKTGKEVLDRFGNRIKNGLLNVTLLESNSQRENVPFVLPVAGNTMFIGGMPEIGALAVIGWRQVNQPIIIGFLPPGVEQLVSTRSTIPNLEEGEVLLQSTNRTVDVENQSNFFRGAQVYLDRYGRIQIDVQDYNLTIGYLLSDEFTPSVSFVLDPVTNENVYLREKLPSGVERRVDDKGNGVWTYGGRCVIQAGGNFELTSQGTNSQTAKETEIGDVQGNKLSLKEGLLALDAPAGSLKRTSQGSETVTLGGNQDTSAIGAVTLVAGEDHIRVIGGDEVVEITGSRKVSIGESDIEQIIEGTKTIAATAGVTIETTGTAPVRLGSSSASSPVPLGDVLVNALTELLTILQTPPGIGFGNLGGPVPLNPAIIALLEQWKQRYLIVLTTNINSGKVFSERG